jgi:tape measure domain-containing protein
MNSAQFVNGVNAAQNSLGGLQNQFGLVAQAAGALGIALSASTYIEFADTWSDLQSRVGVGIGSMDQAADVLDRLSDIATQTYSSLQGTAEGFIENYGTLRDLGLSLEDALNYTEALNNAMVVSGAKGEVAARVQGALSNAMALGALRGDDFNTVLTAGGKVADLLAAELGTTTLGLRAMAEDGKITGDMIQRVLIANMDALAEEAASMPATVGDAFTLIQNAALRLVGAFDQTTGVSAALASGLILISENLQRLATYAAVAAAAFGAKYVYGVVAARVATMTLSSAMTFLKGAIMRTGLGLLIVGAGELVYQFTQLAQKTGGIGEAFQLLAEVASEVWDRIGAAGGAVVAQIVAGWLEFKADFYDILQQAAVSVVNFGNRAIGVMSGALAAIKSIWGSLPGSIADFAYQAANGLISGVESMLNAVVARINMFINGMNAALALLPEWATGEGGVKIGVIADVELGGIDNPYAGAAAKAGEEAGAAFNAALEKTYIDAPEMFAGMADSARDEADTFMSAAGTLREAASKPMTAWQKLKEVMTSAGEDGEAAMNDAAAAAGAMDAAVEDALDAGGGGGGGGGSAAKDKVEELTEAAKRSQSAFETLRDGMASAFTGIVTGSKTAKQAIGELLANLAEMIASNAFKMLFTNMFGDSAKSGGGFWGMMGNLLGGAFANGTPSAPGGLALVGERGPELVNLPRGSRVHTAQETSRMLGGGSVDIRLHVPEGVTAEEVHSIATGVSVRVVSQTATAQRRGLNGSVSELQRRGM